MLHELSVRNLGVIEDVTIVLGPGMTALTGETGAGKTLVVEAIELLVGGLEAALGPGLVGAGSHEHAIGPPADEQLDRLHHEGLAGARLAGQGGHARTEHDGDVLDDSQVADRQLVQHGRGYRGSSPNLAVITRQKSRSPNVTNRAGCSLTRHSTTSPARRRPLWPPSTPRTAVPASTSTRTTSSGPTTSDRPKSE